MGLRRTLAVNSTNAIDGVGDTRPPLINLELCYFREYLDLYLPASGRTTAYGEEREHV